jgi:hypothetical protein
MADQVPVVCNVLATIEARNWDRLARLLHPEVPWTTAAEDELHGPDGRAHVREGSIEARPTAR